MQMESYFIQIGCRGALAIMPLFMPSQPEPCRMRSCCLTTLALSVLSKDLKSFSVGS